MKKLIAIALMLTMCLTTALPLTGFAEEGQPGENGQAEEAWSTSAAYKRVLFTDLLKGNKISASAEMADVKISEYKDGSGIMVKGPAGQLTSGKLILTDSFNFNENPVGRISLSGLTDSSFKGSVKVYLDDQPEPVAVIPLRKQLGSAGWARSSEKTAGVLAKKITGEHAVSISFEINGIEPADSAKILLRSVEFAESSIPVMYFDLDESENSISEMNSSEDHSVECYGTTRLEVPEGYTNEHTDKALTSTDDMALEYIRGRGNSTWYSDKKPYKVKFAKAQNLLGMGSNKHWVLLANRYDNSLVRNRMTYWMVGEHGLKIEFSPKCTPVELVMNGEYYGSYLLSQQVRIGKTRVDIDELDETISDLESEEITGGYLLNLDGSADDDSVFGTSRGAMFEIERPDFGDYPNDNTGKTAKAAQRQYIANYVQDVENAIFGKDFKNKKGVSYRDLLDAQSSIDFWWIQEFSLNGDAYGGGSNYLYKKRNGKLYWGPLWDFDYVAWGNLDYSGDVPVGLDNETYPWVVKCLTDPEYLQQTKDRWDDISKVVQDVIKEGGLLDRYYEETKISQQYDVEKWGYYDEGDGEDIASETDETESKTYKSEIERLRNWIRMRYDWVNKNVNDFKAPTFKVRFKANKKIIEKRELVDGETLGILPKAPKKKGYVFLGWYDMYDDKAAPDLQIYNNTTYTAKYIKSSSVKKAKDIFFSDYQVYSWYDPEEIETFTPEYTIRPYGAKTTGIKWTTSAPSVCSVDKYGTVTPKKSGTAKITATLPSGKKCSYTIYFMGNDDDVYGIENIKLNKKSIKLRSGKYAGLKLTATPVPHYKGEYMWLSVDPSVATVDKFGVVTAKWPGKTMIAVVELETHLVRKCSVTVTKSNAWLRAQAKKAKTTVKAKAVKKHRIKVTWKKTRGSSGYYVYLATKKNGKYKKVAVIKKGGKVKWTTGRLKKGKTYYFKVRPFAKIGKKKIAGKLSSPAYAKAK